MYATSSSQLMQQVRDLLWAVGAPAGVSVDDRADDRPEYMNRSIAWRIRTTPNLTPPKMQFGWTDDDYVYSRVRSVESAEHVSEVFDLEVPVDHSFLTDSYVVHNSAAGLRRGLHAAHHRPRPDPLRPALRGRLPQPEPGLHARHRHGLRLPPTATR